MNVSPTDSNILAAMRAFLIAALPPIGGDGLPVDVVSLSNRVAEPIGTDFVVMSQPRFHRLKTNEATAADCRFTGSIAASSASFTASIAPGAVPGPAVMTVSAFTSGSLAPGAAVTGPGVLAGTTVLAQLTGSPGGTGTYSVTPTQTAPSAALTASFGTMTVSAVAFGTINVNAQVFGVGVSVPTTVAAQLSGPAGGTGTYSVSPSQTAGSTTLASGQQNILQASEVVVQLDFHSASGNAGDMAQTVTTLLRDPFGHDFFAGLAPPLNAVAALYCDDARYLPFINEAQQVEWRWVVDAHLQANQVVVVPQQYADALTLNIISVVAAYGP